MKQRLLLTSQGIQPPLKKDFLATLARPPSKTSVAFVVTGAYYEGDRPKWLDAYIEQLMGCGITDVTELDFRGMSRKALERSLEDKDLIFVNGGSTFYLLHHARKSGFDRIVPDLLAKGVRYVGVSAGSYIACPTIEAAVWKHNDIDTFGMHDLTAMNLVPFLISAHYEAKYQRVIERQVPTCKYPIIALRDTQAVLVVDDHYKVVGTGKKEPFNGFKENWRRQ